MNSSQTPASRLLPLTLVVLCSTPAFAQPGTGADPFTAWGLEAEARAIAARMAPLRMPLTLALLHLAMHDAVNAAPPASAEAAAIEAGYVVLLKELPSEAAALETARLRLLGALKDSTAKEEGRRAGENAARALLAAREHDGRNERVAYTPRGLPGAWAPTPPEHLAVTTAFLARVTPFVLKAPSELRPPGPPDLKSLQSKKDLEEVRTLGAKHSTSRTPAQTATALFWEPIAGTVWPASVRKVARDRGLDLRGSARLHAMTAAAFADSLIACWDAKFHFDSWRPVTAVAATEDASWEPLGVTPNFPEYPAGHACVTAAVAHTIEDALGAGVIPARNVVSGEERLFRSASAAVAEIVEARMLLGVHFRSGDEDGARLGRQVARRVVEHFKEKPPQDRDRDQEGARAGWGVSVARSRRVLKRGDISR